jgi:taurine dioxygenase
MVSARPTGDILGATIEGIDLSRPLEWREFAEILKALGHYGVLRCSARSKSMSRLPSRSQGTPR